MDEWLEWTLKGCFRIDIPADAQTRLDDDGTTAVIRLGTHGAKESRDDHEELVSFDPEGASFH